MRGDNRMDVKTFLKRIRDERLEILRINAMREDIRESMLPSGISYDGVKVQTSPEDHMTEAQVKLAEYDRILVKRLDRLYTDIALAEKVVSSVKPSECRVLLELRYIKQDSDRGPMSWDRIAKSMGYSIYHVQGKLHGKAIQEARRVWDALPQSEKEQV